MFHERFCSHGDTEERVLGVSIESLPCQVGEARERHADLNFWKAKRRSTDRCEMHLPGSRDRPCKLGRAGIRAAQVSDWGSSGKAETLKDKFGSECLNGTGNRMARSEKAHSTFVLHCSVLDGACELGRGGDEGRTTSTEDFRARKLSSKRQPPRVNHLSPFSAPRVGGMGELQHPNA